MNAQTMYKLLESLKKNKSKYEEKTIRFFKFIYDDIYNDLSSNVNEANNDDNYGSNFVSLIEGFKAGITDFIDEDSSSILYYFKEMIEDGKEDFIDAFFYKIDTYFTMMDNHLFRSDDFVPYTLIFNIYAMLRSYNLYKDDFERFNKALENYSDLIEPGSFTNEDCGYGEDFCLSAKKEILDKIMMIDEFEKVPILKEKFDVCFKNICKTDLEDEEVDALSEDIDFICNVVLDMRDLKEKDPEFDENVVFEFLNNWVEYYSEDEYSFYAPILLYGNRFDYIRDCYDEYIDNNEYMDEIISIVKEFDNRLFKYLDSVNKDGTDSFISCMDIVFDSDSLCEVVNKLNILSDASSLFMISPISYTDVLNKIKELSSDRNKKMVGNRKVMYVSDTVNKVDRPTRILDRMTEVYSIMCNVGESEISSRIVDHYGYCETISEFEQGVDASLTNLLEELEEKRISEEERILKELERSKMEEQDDVSASYTSSNEVVNNEENDQSKGIQKSIKRFFGRK